MESERPRRRYVWGCLATAVAGLLALVVAYWFETGYLPVRKFDAAAWRQVQRSDDKTRIQMVESLRWSGRLDGLTRSEVVALLGPPNDDGYSTHDWEMVYWLGPERSLMSIDSEWLVIRLGKDGRVSEYTLARD